MTEDEDFPDLNVRVMFADDSRGELRQLPLNIGNRVTVLYEMTEDSQELTFAGVPNASEDETLHEILTGLIEYLYEMVKSDELREYLESVVEEEENN